MTYHRPAAPTSDLAACLATAEHDALARRWLRATNPAERALAADLARCEGEERDDPAFVFTVAALVATRTGSPAQGFELVALAAECATFVG